MGQILSEDLFPALKQKLVQGRPVAWVGAEDWDPQQGADQFGDRDHDQQHGGNIPTQRLNQPSGQRNRQRADRSNLFLRGLFDRPEYWRGLSQRLVLRGENNLSLTVQAKP